jgi:hypothetical protein
VNAMTFLAPAFLALAALALVIPLLHKRERRRDLRVPSLLLWKRLEAAKGQAVSPQTKPLFSLPVVLQMLALVLLAGALARPVFGPDAALPHHRIYLVDAGGAMQAREGASTKFEAARERLARALHKDIDPDGARISLVLAGPVAEILLARRAPDRDLFSEVRDRLTVSDGRIDWNAVERLIAGVRRAGETEEIVWFTDGSQGSLAARAPRLADASLDVQRIGAFASNAALEARLAPVDGSDKLRLSGRVRFTAGQSDTVLDVSFRSDGSGVPLTLASIPVKAARGEAVAPFTHDLTVVGGGVLSVRLGQDANASDNESRFVIDAAIPRTDILVVGRPRPALLHALQSLPHANVEQRDVLPGDVSRYALVAVVDATVDRQPEASTLWIGEARIAAAARPPAVEPGDVTAWSNRHALSRGIVWNNLSVSRASKLERWKDGDLILAAGDTPLIEARSGKYGREVRIAFDPTREWVAQTSFAQFLDNLLEWTGPVQDHRVRTPCLAGASCPYDTRWSGSTLAAVATSGAPPSITLPSNGEAFRPLRAGLYRHPLGQWLAINPDPQEAASSADEAPAKKPMPPRADLWTWLIGLAAMVLVAEAWISWRRRNAQRWFMISRAAVLLLLCGAALQLPALVPVQQDLIAFVVEKVFDPPSSEASLPRAERPAVVSLTDGPRVVADLGATEAKTFVADGPVGSLTDALRIASAALPPDMETRIVLAAPADGRASDLRALAARLRQEGRRIDVIASQPTPAREIIMSDVEAPQTVFAGESFRLTGRIRASAAADVRLAVSVDGETIAEQDIQIVAGETPVDITIPKAREGDALYRMRISAAGDSIAANNTNGVRVTGRPAPRILVIGAGAAGKELGEGLSQHGFAPKVVVPTGAPWLIEDWLQYDGYIMLDVPALALNSIQQQLIVDAVSRHGRPLLMFGGTRSFGPGGYLETVLDKLSPLSSRVPKPSPEATVVYVIDRSGSMSQAVGDVDRLAIAKQATMSAMKLLNPQSKVSVIAFDTEARVVAPLQSVANMTAIGNAMQQMTPGGGTDLFPAMNLAFEQISKAESSIKHVIVFTDGLIPPAPFDPLVERMTVTGVSISTVSVGTGGGDNVLRGISRLGRGAFHATNDFRALPSIIAQETMLLSDSAVEERVSSPEWVGERPAYLSGLPDRLPDVEGYVLTTAKPDAQISIKVPTADGGDAPLVASWQFGSGKVMAMTTQINGPWTKQWMEIPQYLALWSQVIPHFLSGADATGITLRAERRREGIAITATALDKFRKARTELQLSAQIRDISAMAREDAVAARIDLAEIRPGVYEGVAPVVAPGDYAISVADGDKVQTATLHIAYPQALAFEDEGGALLANIAGGRVLKPGEPVLAQATLRFLVAPNWLVWGLAAFAAFCVELLVRYRSALWPTRRTG